MFAQNRRLFIILTTALSILLVPLIAMQLTNEVNWSLTDFLVAGCMLAGVGLLIELVLRKVTTVSKRTLVLVVIAILFLLLWAELAVGIFGTPLAGD